MRNFAAVFPGQGSQHQGMGKELFENFKIAQETFEEASDAVKIDMKRLCFEETESELKLTANTQPALVVTSIAAWRVFQAECGLKPSVCLGHSLGEFSALVAAGALTLSDAMKSVRVRGLAMQEAVPVGIGGMIAIMGLEDSVIEKACHDMQNLARTDGKLNDCIIEAANYNCPGQVVVSGHLKALEYMKSHLKAENYGATRMKLISVAVSAPFHSSLMQPAAERLKIQLEKVKFENEFPLGVIHNVTAHPNHDGSKIKKLLFEQITKPVLWSSSVRNAHAQGATHFAEFGAGRILAGLIRKISPDVHALNADTLENLKKTMTELAP